MTRSFEESLRTQADLVWEEIVPFLPPEEGHPDDPEKGLNVTEAMNYSILAGGKRLRPLLMSCAFALFHGENRRLLAPFLAAIEMIHTYSLVHDDLPAMDNDEYRRGRKTTHVVYGEACAILAGDGLLNYAYETAMTAADACASGDDLRRVMRALRLLAKKAGIGGMIGGQCVDIESEREGADGISDEEKKRRLAYIHENKTAALIEAALMCGAVLAGASAEDTKTLEEAGSLLGMTFQIRDDILDVEGTQEILGKPIGSDEKNGKLTYVSLYGLAAAKEDAKRFTEDAIRRVRALGAAEDSFFVQLLYYLMEREK